MISYSPTKTKIVKYSVKNAEDMVSVSWIHRLAILCKAGSPLGTSKVELALSQEQVRLIRPLQIGNAQLKAIYYLESSFY